jgi:hypothetical protein
MESLFFLVCVIEIIIQIVSIVKFKKLENSKYWNIFIGITIASFISVALAYIIFENNDTMGLDQALKYMFICCFSFVSNLILFIIGLKLKKNLKNKNIELNEISIVTGILIILLSIMFLIIIPNVYSQTSNNLISNNIITYLKEKYGDNNFEIINVENDYSYNGIIEKYHSGYEVTISSPLLKDNFVIYTYGTNPTVLNNVSEKFIETYYIEKTNEYLKKKYNLDFDMSVEEKSIPNTCEHIPTFDELVDYNAIKNVFIKVYKNNYYNYDYDENGRINYLKDLSLDLINYLNISKDINIKFSIWSIGNSYYYYDIQILSNTLKIVDDNDKIYEFDINNLKIKE